MCYMIGLSVKLYAVAVLPNAGYIGPIRLVTKVLGFLTDISSTHGLISGYETNPFDTPLTVIHIAPVLKPSKLWPYCQ